jgi:hydrogenase nickel incorporation protein HypA/HybF
VHEYSIVSALLDRIEVEARSRGASSVASIRVAIGGQAGLDPDLLRSAFEIARAGTPCAAAALELREIPAVWRCRVCGGELRAEGPRRCPSCDAPGRLDSGDEIVLESLELEVA